MDENEFVFTEATDEEGNKTFVGGGYKIESFFLKQGTPLMTTYNNKEQSENDDNETDSSIFMGNPDLSTFDEIQNGGKRQKVSTPFESLAVPAGLFYISQRQPKPKHTPEEHYGHNVLSDNIHDKLFALIQYDNKRKRQTRKHRNNGNEKLVKKTRGTRRK
jgi:hypothetical protein